MKVLIIGGVAAGTKAAAKLKREDRSMDVKIITKSDDISYAGCALPYYVGGSIESPEQLIVSTPQKYSALTNVEVLTGCEATKVDTESKTVSYTNLHTGEKLCEGYDKLIISTGAVPFIPDMDGTELPGVFCMRTPKDAIELRKYIKERKCRSAVVAGAGFIGLEAAENLMAQGLNVTVIDAAPQIMPNAFDREMADFAKRKLGEAGMHILTGTRILSIAGSDNAKGVVTDAGTLPCDVAVLAIGVRPATGFLSGSGIELIKGAIVVNEYMETSVKDVYAAGDCALVRNSITGKLQWSAMGSTANLSARSLAKTLAGDATQYGGCLGTGVVKLLADLNAGRTGLTELQAKNEGYDAVSVICIADDKPHYYPGSSDFIIKLVADMANHRILGLQVLGAGPVDKISDMAVIAINKGAVLEDFDTLDLSYAPPFSTAIHPFTLACHVLENKLGGSLDSFTPVEYEEGCAKDYRVIDVQMQAKIPGAAWVDLTRVNGPIDGIGKDEKLLLVCTKGKHAYLLQNRLKFYGYTNTKVLEGGTFFNQVRAIAPGSVLPAEEIKRVKGLGCLQDKRYPDRFNIRVITRNGKLTSSEQYAISQAAELFGSGEVTMTTRLTLEIQDVPYSKIDDVIEFLHKAGLDTGGTGSKVRPVVSCKGTTCQYGLIDTFSLSQKLHELYYVGYHQVSLPHKFKIAVGGCPNNCVKPDLNDLGIVGQRMPQIDLSKCHGCKVCQVENICPIHVAKVEGDKIVINPDTCNHCGRCIGKCPFNAVNDGIYGYRIYIGGRWGKKVAQGRPLDKLFTSEEEVISMVENAILFFRDEGISGERFADTIARLGFEYVQDKLLSGKVDKNAIMNKTVIGGATC